MAGDEPGLAALISSASADMSELVRDEIALAKAELRRDAKHASTGGAAFAVAALLGLLILVMLSIAAVYGIHALGLGKGWSALIVAGGQALVAGICVLVGIRLVRRVRGPQSALRSTKESVAALQAVRDPH